MPIDRWMDKEVVVYKHDGIFSSVQSCPTLCDPMNHSTPGLPVHHQLPESTQTHVHWVSDAIQPFHPLSFPSPPAPNLSQHQHQGLFKWVSYYSAIKKEHIWVLMRWMDLEPVIKSEASQKEKDKYHILTHIYRIWKNGTEEFIYRTIVEKQT